MVTLVRLCCVLAVCLVLSACGTYELPTAPEGPVVVTSDLAPVYSPCPFPRTADRLSKKESITIVAIGSSSTVGAGASSSSKTYPSLLKASLMITFPELEIVVYNKGVNGDTAAQNLARFESDIIALQPHLVIWQVGTNDALRDIPFVDVEQVIESGIARLRLHQIDVALLDLQFLGGESDSKLAKYQVELERVAERLKVTRVLRWSLMKDAVESGRHSLADLVTRDGLHTTDIPYQQTADHTARVITQTCAVTKKTAK